MQLLLSTVCLVLTSTVVSNAFIQKQQFYPAVVYITKSNASMAVIYVQFFVIVFMFGKLLRKIFLGTLRAAEFEHLLERFWYALTETCLAFTVFRDDFNPRFVALFTVLLFLKSFHWLAEERVDFMERSPVLGWLFHIRVSSLLVILGLLDNMLLMHAYNSTLMRGPTVQLVFGFEYAILLTVIASTAIKYVLHAAEMRTDTPWENKAVFLLYTELVIGLIKVILYVMFVVIMAKFYALPMFVFRPMFFTIRNFKKALSDVIMSRRAIRNMNTLYPDATTEELRLSDNICIICREDMINHSKKLPCGHIFHTTCLRSWFQRQQTCPTCRLNILRASTPNSTAMPRQDEAAVQARAGAAAATPIATPVQTNPDAIAVNNANVAPNLPNMFGNMMSTNPLLNTLPGFAGIPTNLQTMPIAPPPFMMAPPFPFVAPFTCPPPPMPSDLTNLTDDELKAMEGNERRNIEERLKLLKNIHIMLDAAGELMNHYQVITANLQITTNTNDATKAAQTTTTTTTATTQTSAATATTTTATSVNDGPSTSAAAATANLNESLAPAPNITTIKQPNATATTNITAAAAVAATVVSNEKPLTPTTSSTSKLNDVTIEDLGADDCDDNQKLLRNNKDATAIADDNTTLITHLNNDKVDATELKKNELRKLRLRFLEQKP